MDKNVIESFIKKYALNGECEKAHWYSDSTNETLTARAHTEEKSVILKVVMKGWQGMKTCQLALPSASKIKSMLNPIGDDVTITLNELRERVTSFTISDSDCEAICTVADYDAFPETLDIDEQEVGTGFEVEILLNTEFKERLVKAMAALSEAKDFVLMNNKQKKLDMIINYEDINTNRIRLPVTTVDGKDQINTPVGFSTPILKAILASNPDVDGAILKATGNGMAAIEFSDDKFDSKYLLFPTRILD
jgi:hypothetical protein